MRAIWIRLRRNKLAMFGLVVVVILILFALFADQIADYKTVAIKQNIPARYMKPCAEHIFGTDNVGNEVFDVVWAGARNSIIISFVCTAITMILGVTIGAIWGFSKKMDKWMIEVFNVIANVPFLLLAMILSYILGAGFGPLILTMTTGKV